ncbi:DUF935 domain-containing protein (plasmid) [Azospirillum argentinense]|uniref:DUF935 domain-containing protein n=1 Tax=Azospirillum argentinense TaxID=2970906 RepID=A0A4D8PU82_9PROT|nr:DUF935 domain-containing protein [Azospirillum argentinense]QCN98905.1 DUF935 domain-containing protein [Azospirillum argentinense]
MPPSAILGPDGRPMQRQTLAAPQATPTVTGVRPVLSEHPARGLTPERLAGLLRASEDGDATRYLELAEDMEERDLHYRGVLATRKLSISQLEVTVEAASDEPDDQAAADLVRAALDAADVEELLFDLQDGLGKGYSVVEMIWDTSRAPWRVVGFEHRDPRWFQFDRTDGRTLRLVDGTPDGAPLEPNRFIIHTPKTKSGLPIRGGLARAAAWAFLFKNFAIKDWVVFAEVYGHPLRLGKYGPGASEPDKDILLDAVRNLGTDAAAIIPQSMLIELVTSNVTGIDLWEKLANYLDRQVSKAVLGQTATTDAISGGHAVGQEHRQVQKDIERADGRQTAGTLNRDFVPVLVSVNMGPRPVYPKIRIGRPDEEDIGALVERVVKLVPLGLKVGMSTMRDKIGLPDPGDEEELLTVPGTAAETPSDRPGTDPAQTETASVRPAPEGARFDLDAAIAEQLATEGWDMGAVIDPVRELLDGADSLEEVRARLRDPEVLAKLLGAMDTSRIEEALTRGGTAAWLAGLAEGAD